MAIAAVSLTFAAGPSAAQEQPGVTLQAINVAGPNEYGEYEASVVLAVTGFRSDRSELNIITGYRLPGGTWPAPVTFFNMSQCTHSRRAAREAWAAQCPSRDCPNEPLTICSPPNTCHPAEFVGQSEEACRGLANESIKISGGFADSAGEKTITFHFQPPAGVEELRFVAEHMYLGVVGTDWVYAYDVSQSMRLADIPPPGTSPPPDVSDVAPTETPEPTTGPELGVSMPIRVEASGYEPIRTTIATQDYVPSSIDLSGYVRDQEGQPIPGASVTLELAAGEISATTDATGFYRLYVETAGTRPFSDAIDWQLTMIPTAVGVQIELPDVIWVPGETPLTIRAVDGAGKPLSKGTVIISVVDLNNNTIPFLSVSEESGRWLDKSGTLSTRILTRDPKDWMGGYVYARDVPLEAKILVEIKDRGEHISFGQTEVVRPFNLARIQGVTVGPDMQPRDEWDAPQIGGSPTFVLWREKDDSGGFWLLVRPLHPETRQEPPGGWILVWGMGDHLPLEYPLKGEPAPGGVLDVGKVDVLTPEEHQERLIRLMEEFILAMPLKLESRMGVFDSLRAIVFAVDTSKSVPFYRDNALGSSGTVYYPDQPATYWGQNLLPANDPAYVIMSHELGHFLHHALIERHSLRHFCYKFGVGLSHETWKAPESTIMNVDLSSLEAKEYTSFSESNGDFFASLLIPFWLAHHPEMAESIYLQNLGYLTEFDTDDQAIAALSGVTPGYVVEGVQTRFLRALYAPYLKERPEWAYADYLATMWLYMDKPESWTPGFLTRPARTIDQWVKTKARLGSPIGLSTGDVSALALRYRLRKPTTPSVVGTYPVMPMPMPLGNASVVLLQGQQVDFDSWGLPMLSGRLGDEIEVERGAVAIEPSGNREGGTIVLREKARVLIRDTATVEVRRGMVAIEGPVKAVSPSVSVTPGGTVYVLEVAESGDTRISVFEGTVVAESRTGEVRTLGAGQRVGIVVDGAIGQTEEFNVHDAAQELLPAGAEDLNPFEPAPSISAAVYDLVVKRLDYMPFPAVAGQPVQFTTMIATDVYPEAGPFFPASRIRWRPMDDAGWTEIECPADSHYASCMATFEYVYTQPGRYQVQVEADTGGQVPETDEANNALALLIEVAGEPAPPPAPTATQPSAAAVYDLVVKRLDFSPFPAVAGQPVQFTTMIATDVYPEAGPFFPASRIRWRPMDDAGWTEIECPADSHYAPCMATFEYVYTQPGRYQVQVEADTGGQVPETDEANNALALLIEVSGEPAPPPTPAGEQQPVGELNVEAAAALMPSAQDLGIDSLPWPESFTDQVPAYGQVTVFGSMDQTTGLAVSLMAFERADAAAGFVAEQRQLYQDMGAAIIPVEMGDEGFTQQFGEQSSEVLVRIDRYVLDVIGNVSVDQVRPSVERLQAYASGR